MINFLTITEHMIHFSTLTEHMIHFLTITEHMIHFSTLTEHMIRDRVKNIPNLDSKFGGKGVQKSTFVNSKMLK